MNPDSDQLRIARLREEHATRRTAYACIAVVLAVALLMLAITVGK